jgi:hypothetical protein
MNLLDDLPERPIKRFVIGFCVAGLLAFVVVVLNGDTFRDSIAVAGLSALILGAISGTLSAFGKKMLRFILWLAGEVITGL